ncbi:MAG: autotransporter-associated beta strand repeat-containing protein, partial [Verrucomicrobiota bacterium]
MIQENGVGRSLRISNFNTGTTTSTTELGASNTFTGGLLIGRNAIVSITNSGALNSTAGSENAVDFDNYAFSTGAAGSYLQLNGNSIAISKLTNSGTTYSSTVWNNSATTAATLTVGNSLNLTGTFGGVLTDGTVASVKSLGLTKAGTGAFTLTGNNTYTGATTINSGTLALGAGGSIASSGTLVVGSAGSSGAVLDTQALSGFTVGSTQTLKGKGTVNVGTGKALTVNGILAPGNSIGTLNVTGNYIFGSTSTYQVEMDASSSDLIAISGTATINSSAAITFTGATGLGKYTLATASGGGFDGVNKFTGSAPTDYRLFYSGTSLDLTHKATIGTISATPTASAIIIGGTTAVSVTVGNSAPTNSSDLAFTATAGGNMTGSATGSAVAGNSGMGSGLKFTSNTVGLAQSGTFTITDANATNSGQASTVSVDVLGHSNAALAIASGNHQTIITGGSLGTVSLNLTNAGTTIAGLDVSTLSNLSGASGANVVAAGGTATYTASGF